MVVFFFSFPWRTSILHYHSKCQTQSYLTFFKNVVSCCTLLYYQEHHSTQTQSLQMHQNTQVLEQDDGICWGLFSLEVLEAVQEDLSVPYLFPCLFSTHAIGKTAFWQKGTGTVLITKLFFCKASSSSAFPHSRLLSPTLAHALTSPSQRSTAAWL